MTSNLKDQEIDETWTKEEAQAYREFQAEAELEAQAEMRDEAAEYHDRTGVEVIKTTDELVDWRGDKYEPSDKEPRVTARWTHETGWVLFGEERTVYLRGQKCCGCQSAASQHCEDCDCHIDYHYELRAEMASARQYYGGSYE